MVDGTLQQTGNGADSRLIITRYPCALFGYVHRRDELTQLRGCLVGATKQDDGTCIVVQCGGTGQMDACAFSNLFRKHVIGRVDDNTVVGHYDDSLAQIDHGCYNCGRRGTNDQQL